MSKPTPLKNTRVRQPNLTSQMFCLSNFAISTVSGSKLKPLVFAFAIALFLFGTMARLGGAEKIYYLALGEKIEEFETNPIVHHKGQTFVSFEAIRRLSQYRSFVEKEKKAPGPTEDETKEAIQEAEGRQVRATESDTNTQEEEINENEIEPSEKSVRESIEVLRPSSKMPITQAVESTFTFNNRDWRIFQEGGRAYLQDLAGKSKKFILLQKDGQIFIPEDALSELGLKLSYSSEHRTSVLLGEPASVRFDRSKNSLILRTIVPSIAYAEATAENSFKVVLKGCFLKSEQVIRLPEELKTKALAKPFVDGRILIEFTQSEPTGYKLYAEEKPFTYFRIHFDNHFDLISFEKVASGEIALAVQFTKKTKLTDRYLTAPDRLVLDFEGAIYDEATKRIPVNVGGVREIRLAQFMNEPRVVRVVVEMTTRLAYRILEEAGGRAYYVQFSKGKIKGATVMLDAGHGGSDTGAIGVSKVYEKDITLSVTKRVQQRLESMGIKVLMTRENDRFVSLGERADLANKLLPSVFVSIHANSIPDPSFTGVMTFHFKDSEAGRLLANLIHGELLSRTGAVDKGVRTANFFVLRETVVPAVLVEIGFLTNEYEETKLKDPFYQDIIAEAVSRGVFNYLQKTGGF